MFGIINWMGSTGETKHIKHVEKFKNTRDRNDLKNLQQQRWLVQPRWMEYQPVTKGVLFQSPVQAPMGGNQLMLLSH